jgi:hypothetical protein
MEVDSIVKNMHIAILKEIAALNQNFEEQDKVIANLYKDNTKMKKNTEDNFHEFKSFIAKIFDKIGSKIDQLENQIKDTQEATIMPNL